MTGLSAGGGGADGRPVVSVEGLGVVYRIPRAGSRWGLHWFHTRPLRALEGVSFKLNSGGSLGVIGPNGCGKSTLLKTLAGVLEPSEGRYTIDGRVGAFLELGVGFEPELSGRENVALYGGLLGIPSETLSEKVPEIFSFAELEGFEDAPVRTYSSGMLLRLAFAIAITLESDILLIDEALSVGDLDFRSKCYRTLLRNRRSGQSVILASHDMRELSLLADRVILLDGGRVAAEGPYRWVMERYLRAVGVDSPVPLLGSKSEALGGYGSMEGRVVRVRLEGPAGDGAWEERYEFLRGEPFAVRLSLRCSRPISAPVLLINLSIMPNPNQGWGVLFRLPPLRSGEEVEVFVPFENDLPPGLYRLSLGLRHLAFELPIHVGIDAAAFRIGGASGPGTRAPDRPFLVRSDLRGTLPMQSLGLVSRSVPGSGRKGRGNYRRAGGHGAVIDLAGVSLRYRVPLSRPDGTRGAMDVWALRGIDLSVRRGESVGLLGRNGSGKSTLLKIIAGVLAPTEGRTEVRGTVGPFLDLSVGFEPELTAKDNIRIFGTLLGMDRSAIESRINGILAFAELEEFGDVEVKRFSKGMFLRLAISTAIQMDPDILLVDEAFAVGDIGFQERCYEAIEAFKSRGKTIVLASHNLLELRRVCDRLVLLEDGRKEADGTVDDVMDYFITKLHARNESVSTIFCGEFTGYRTPVGENRVLRGARLVGSEGGHPTLEIAYDAGQPVENPTISVHVAGEVEEEPIYGIYRSALPLSEVPPKLEGSGSFRLRLASVPRRPGRYLLIAGLNYFLFGESYQEFSEPIPFTFRGGDPNGTAVPASFALTLS